MCAPRVGGVALGRRRWDSAAGAGSSLPFVCAGGCVPSRRCSLASAGLSLPAVRLVSLVGVVSSPFRPCVGRLRCRWGRGSCSPPLLFVGGVVFSPRCPLCRASSLSVGGVGRVPPPCSTSPSRSRLVVVGGGAGRVPPRAQPHRVGQGWSRDGG